MKSSFTGSSRTVHSKSVISQSSSIKAVVPRLKAVRQSEETDVRDARLLETPISKVLFGEVDLYALVEKAVCRSLFNSEGKLVALLVVRDFPNIATLSHCNWQSWLRRYYRIDIASPSNTLFVHYLVWDLRYPGFLIHFLKHFYKNIVLLQHFILISPPGVQLLDELTLHFTAVYPKGNGVGTGTTSLHTNIQTIYLNLRLSVVKKLIIRKAGEEDNIDVQPILHYQYNILKQVFGDFKLGSVIDLNDKNKAVIVGENVKNMTVGVMALTSSIDYQMVQDFFYVPLPGLLNSDEITLDMSKFTLKDRDMNIRSDEDLTPLKPGLMGEVEDGSEDYEDDEDDVASEVSVDRSFTSTMYLEDDDSEFRIVDPAMQFILNKKPLQTIDSYDSANSASNSTVSLEYNTYYGRPSWSIKRTSSIQTVRLTCAGAPTYSYYTGPEEGFRISLFALHPDLDVRYAFDLLEASFECYLEKNFCLLSLPTSYQGSPLTKHFVRLTPKMARDFPYELYYVHRNSIFSEFNVRLVSFTDLEEVSELVESVSQSKKIRRDLVGALIDEQSEDKAFVLECENCIVGVAVVSTNFILQRMQPHFKIERTVNLRRYGLERHGLLRHSAVNVMFLKHAPFFLRQILHKAGLDTLSYVMFQPDVMPKMDVTLPTVLGELCPVLPRKRITYDPDLLGVSTPDDYVQRLEHEFAFFIATEKLLDIPTLELNYRIVVVGASDTALSFLENLIFEAAERHIRYNNLMLISIHGLPLYLKPHAATDKMIPHCGHFSRDYLARLGLQTHVNTLYGVLTVINRKEKMICLNDEHWLRYDYLFLFTGTQFCKPTPCFPKEKKPEGKDHCSVQATPECGENFFLVNTIADAAIALGGLKKIAFKKTTGKVIVYGNTINIFTCVAALLEFGVPGVRIVLIESIDVCKRTGIDTNSTIEKVIIRSLEQAGVTIYHGYSLITWTMKKKFVTNVMFRTDTNVPLTLPCLALFCYGTKITSAKTYMALTNSGIVFNDGIIINSKFSTNDEYIFAAGPATRYSSRYQTVQADHVFYSSVEVGKEASLMFRRLVEPWPENEEEDEDESVAGSKCDHEESLPRLRDPVTVVAHLPGGWYYTRISAPGRPLPLECQLHGQGDTGYVLITGDPIDPTGPGYFQLSLSSFNTVREIVCLCKKEIPFNNLVKLYGLHEKVLNNLVERFSMGLVPDLYAFLSEPWALALYTADFSALIDQCADIFFSNEEAGIGVIRRFQEQTRHDGVLYNRVSLSDQAQISSLYHASTVPLYVENLTMRYVGDHELQLPVYITDDLLSSIHRSYQHSPLHRDQNRHRPRLLRDFNH